MESKFTKRSIYCQLNFGFFKFKTILSRFLSHYDEFLFLLRQESMLRVARD